MRYFITGASGWIGSAVTAELIENGHEVVGLARSDASAAKLEAMGALVQRGDLEDLDSLRAGAEGTDGIVHCGFIHDFSAFEKSVAVNHAAVELFGELLEGTGKPLVIASGILGFFTDETQRVDPADAVSRMATEALLLGLADRGVRSVSVRLAPTVHGQGDHGFIASMVAADKDQGAAGYIAGTHWPAVHRFDAAHLFCIALDRAPAGTVMHAIAESGVSIQAVAEAVGAGLGIPVREVPEAQALEFFGWLGRFLALDTIATSEITQREFDWKPTHPTLLEDLGAGYYF